MLHLLVHFFIRSFTCFVLFHSLIYCTLVHFLIDCLGSFILSFNPYVYRFNFPSVHPSALPSFSHSFILLIILSFVHSYEQKKIIQSISLLASNAVIQSFMPSMGRSVLHVQFTIRWKVGRAWNFKKYWCRNYLLFLSLDCTFIFLYHFSFFSLLKVLAWRSLPSLRR